MALASVAFATAALRPQPAQAVAPAPSPDRTAAADAGRLLPDLNVTDVKTGKPTSLRGVVDGKRAVLLWFWAPH